MRSFAVGHYSEVALQHEDAKVVLQRLQSQIERCGAARGTCAGQPADSVNIGALLSEISSEWDDVEEGMASALLLAAISWLLMSYAAGRSLEYARATAA